MKKTGQKLDLNLKKQSKQIKIGTKQIHNMKNYQKKQAT